MVWMTEHGDSLSPASPAATIQASREDDRPKLPEPPPVALVAVQDVQLPMVAGLERKLDEFYRDLVGFERVERSADMGEGPVYRSANHDLVFHVVEVPDEGRGNRLIGILTSRYRDIVQRLIDMNVDFEIVRGVTAGAEELLIQDPAGNWIALSAVQEIR
jgi:hypothetical protein